MRKEIPLRTIRIGLLLVAFASTAGNAQQIPVETNLVRTQDIDREIRQFLQREITAHVVDIKTLDPPPDELSAR